jgi:hypothetical protein
MVKIVETLLAEEMADAAIDEGVSAEGLRRAVIAMRASGAAVVARCG